jgi:hypothetical protein
MDTSKLFCSKLSLTLLLGAGLSLCTPALLAGTATSISGLYTTGSTTSNTSPFVDSHWYVSNTASQTAYVVMWGAPSDWATSSSARWISAASNGYPGTSVDYSYALDFNIAGNGSGAVGNVAVNLTLYVDDTAKIYVNGVQTAIVSGSSRWTTPTTLTLGSNFNIGTNTISVQVANSGGGASGVMVSAINGKIVPEVGAVIPLIGAFVAFLVWRMRRAKKLPLAA